MRKRLRLRRGSLVTSLVLCAWIAGLAEGAAAPVAKPDGVLAGRVVGPDGPARGAVVVSDAGGKAVTGPDGSFELEVELAPSVVTLRVTAVASSASGSLVGSLQVPPPASGALQSVGDIVLRAGAGCDPAWLPTFGGTPGTDGAPLAFAVFDDGGGGGPALYAAGGFSSAGGVSVSEIAKWDGSRWWSLGAGLDGLVYALAVYDDGSGARLYAGGSFIHAGGDPVVAIASWDGASWSDVGGSMPNPYYSSVYALAVYDDGNGSALYAGGNFTQAGGVSASRIAKWNGSQWTPLASGVGQGEVHALAVFDDGGGPALYAGGTFALAGLSPANCIASWQGTTWSALGSGVAGTQPAVYALAVYDDGGGSALYAGGKFETAGGLSSRGIARWDGSAWSALEGGMAQVSVRALATFDDGLGGGSALYVGGDFTASADGVPAQRVARWDGASWSVLGTGMDDPVTALFAFEQDGEPALFAAGDFDVAGDAYANHVATWDGADWSALGKGLDGSVRALAVFDDGGGPDLYAGGSFDTAAGNLVGGVARWDGTDWTSLGTGTSYPADVHALAVFDDGGPDGPALYVGGEFPAAGGVPASRIARWNGVGWSALGSGTNDVVLALRVYDDELGGGPALYLAGEFTVAGGVAANRIARWDGASFTPLGSGLNGDAHALAVFDDGPGAPRLYVGGEFWTAGGNVANRIARWDGSAWSNAGSGTNGVVRALAVFDDGDGPALYAGGGFTMAGGVPTRFIGSWDGARWSVLGLGMNQTVRALHVGNLGSGAALYAGGAFTSAGGVLTNFVARWDGGTWSALDSGMDGAVLALCSFDDGSGPKLFAGGAFERAYDSGDAYLARFGFESPGCSSPGTAYCFGDGSGTPCPCGNEASGSVGCANSTGSGALLGGSGAANTADDTLTLFGKNLRPNQPALLFQGNQAVNGGLGVGFGDGLRCAGGGVIRIAVLVPDARGNASYPGAGDPSISSEGGAQPGDIKRYQLWYRDPGGSPCGSGFNLSSGYEIAWK